MAYTVILEDADSYISHLDDAVDLVDDPLFKNRYIGFLCVTAVTFFEEAFKDIVIEFAKKKHPVFGVHIESSYDRLNGRISLSEIRKSHVIRFGEKYKKRFDSFLEIEEKSSLGSGGGSIKSSYGNILTWRNNFVHGGNVPSNASYDEARTAYNRSKTVFICLDRALKR
ncbi:HEPN domain-containing protein [Aurantimonas sp. HBX-1]|uniref:HEPN domain-containing protein n=1 Tax=Aurantimonas sp. HBX-1 TaxID=2906072 RepID=UPI001F28A74E|nr:HEPN domain-containing protein [Aurantimonas sp. HBX-1]UIJ72994.1 hypothetical protein LXB15_04910 [Aurantimonas sp. HBX-1]